MSEPVPEAIAVKIPPFSVPLADFSETIAIPTPSFPTVNWWSFTTVTRFLATPVLFFAKIAIALSPATLIVPWFSISTVGPVPVSSVP